jgi:hypothetical protein
MCCDNFIRGFVISGAFKMFDTENRGYLETKELTELILYLFSCEKYVNKIRICTWTTQYKNYLLIDCTDPIFIRVRRDAPEEKTLRLKKSRKGNFRRAINISEAANALLLEMDRNRDGEKKPLLTHN